VAEIPQMNRISSIIALVLLLGKSSGLSQGFVNLNFENAVLSPDPNSPYYPNAVYASNAIPGWTAYIGGVPQTDIFYDNISLGAPAVILQDTNGFFQPLQGRYSLLIQGSSLDSPISASIGQTGLLPNNAVSLFFFLSLNSSLQVTFNGQPISLVQVASTPNYDVMGGNISAFAGQTGQLLFTSPGNSGFGLVDDIQFSPSPIPEPGVFALSAVGVLMLAIRRRRKSI
jgi:hypothetical protein